MNTRNQIISSLVNNETSELTNIDFNKCIDMNVDNMCDEESMKSLHHCLNCLNCINGKSIEDNGIAISSTLSVSENHEPMESSIISLRSPSSKTIKLDECNHNSLITKSIEDNIMGAGFERALCEQGERIDRLEKSIDRLIGHFETQNSTTGQIQASERLIQFDDKIPHKITIQYFLNEGTKLPPRVKMELRHKVRDGNGKPYYKAYETVFGNCYKDFGLNKLDKFSGLIINSANSDDIFELRKLVKTARDTFTDDKDMIGTFFYDVETSEVFTNAYIIIDKTELYGKLFINGGTKFVAEYLEFITPKSAGQTKSSDGIYTINKDRVEVIFDGGDSVE